MCDWVDGKVKQGDKMYESQLIECCWQQDESRDVLYLIICKHYLNCGGSRLQHCAGSEVTCVIDDAVRLVRYFVVGDG
jgi:hypothetical protein